MSYDFLYGATTPVDIAGLYAHGIANFYKIFEKNGDRYMIVQFMSDECIDNGEDTLLLLYCQIDTVAYTSPAYLYHSR